MSSMLLSVRGGLSSVRGPERASNQGHEYFYADGEILLFEHTPPPQSLSAGTRKVAQPSQAASVDPLKVKCNINFFYFFRFNAILPC